MADEMSSIPPRVGALEQTIHTLHHRVTVLEDTNRDMPQRMTKVEIAVERLPQIEAKLSEQGDMIKRGFFMTHGIMMGAGFFWAVFQAGPELLKFLGGR